jgi:predicted dehydrogenase
VPGEKPLALTIQESSAQVDLVTQYEGVVDVNYNIRHYPLNIEARRSYSNWRTGGINSIYGSYVQACLLYPTDYNWCVLEEDGTLRAVADIGTHWLDLLQTITGLEVVSVCANLKTVHTVRQDPKGELETFSGQVRDIEPPNL